MLTQAIKSKIITPGDSLFEAALAALKKQPLGNGDVLVITSKVVAVAQGRVKKISSKQDFDKLVSAEADKIIGKSQVTLTLKKGIFIPWAGIDRSNVKKGYAVLWPDQPFKVAQQILNQIKKKYRLKNLGVIISDSHCVPLRNGVTGIAIGYAGFKGVNDLRGKKDLYGNKLEVTQQNIADMLATAANLVMGEAAEQTPFALIKNAPVQFTTQKTDPRESLISPKDCLFSPLYAKINAKNK
jgi:coenzyme F420-0:L-glutamate ligase